MKLDWNTDPQGWLDAGFSVSHLLSPGDIDNLTTLNLLVLRNQSLSKQQQIMRENLEVKLRGYLRND